MVLTPHMKTQNKPHRLPPLNRVSTNRQVAVRVSLGSQQDPNHALTRRRPPGATGH